MSKELITELSQLKAERDYLLRQIDIYYYDKKKRHINFIQLKKVDKQIEKLKFKIALERRIKNDTNSDSN